MITDDDRRTGDDRPNERDSDDGDDTQDQKSSPSTPFSPDKDDDTPLGDTDQHSDA